MNRRPRFAVAASPGFISAVLLLLANDHVFKAAFPGVITGKLSDVAGLFVVGALTVAAVPSRTGMALGGIAAVFIFWKSPLSQPLIDGWNAVGPFMIARVVDWTDLVALAALPVSLLYARRARWTTPSRVIQAALVAVTALAIGATSKVPRPMPPDPTPGVVRSYPQATFVTALSVADTVRQLRTAGFDVGSMLTYGDDLRTNVRCGVDDSPSRALVAATIRMEARDEGTAIVVTSAAFCRAFAPPTRDMAIEAFQREVLGSVPDARLIH
jgi:hypothetical protein